MANGMAGAIIYEIQKAGFEISAIQTVNSFFLNYLYGFNNNISYQSKGFVHKTKRRRVSWSL